MDFEEKKNTEQPHSEISDEARFNATTKRVPLEPIHDDVVPDELSDEAEGNRRASDAPMANIDIDREETNVETAQPAADIDSHGSEHYDSDTVAMPVEPPLKNTPPPMTASGQPNSHSLPVGQIIFGVVILALLAGLIVFFFVR